MDRPQGPVFVVGSMGSGTTLMRLVLDSHENLAIAQETTFLRAVLAHKWIPFWKFGGAWYKRLGWNEEELEGELREFYERIFGRFASQQGATRWGDKSPHHLWMMREAAKVWPEAVFVATVRHPGAVMASLQNRFKWEFTAGLNHWMRAAAELAHRAEDLGDQLIVVRYEDMVFDLESTMKQVLELIDEPWSPRVLEHHVVHAERGGPTKVEGMTRATDPIDRARVAKWAAQLDEPARKQLRRRAREWAKFYGYDVNDAEALTPLLGGASGRPNVLTGTDLAQRRGEFPKVNWKYRPSAGMANQQLRPEKMKIAPAVPKAAKRKAPDAPTEGKKQSAQAAAGRPPSPWVRTAVAKLPDPVRDGIKRLAASIDDAG